MNLKDLVGSWSGSRTEIESGVGVTNKTTINGNIRSDGGVLLIEKGTSPIIGDYTSRDEFHKSGKYKGVSKTSYGLIISSSSGRWKMTKDGIAISGTGGNLSGTGKFSGLLRMPSKDRFVYSGRSRGTVLVKLTGRRVQ